MGFPRGASTTATWGFTAGWGREWFPGFSGGLALRALQQKVVNDLCTSLAGDAGILWSPNPRLRLGLCYLNLGTPVAGNALAGELREGASLLLDVGPHFTLLTALAGAWAPGGVGSAQGGLEGVLEGQWALRLGYQLPFYNNFIEGFSGLTAGAGFKISSLALDYAYL